MMPLDGLVETRTRRRQPLQPPRTALSCHHQIGCIGRPAARDNVSTGKRIDVVVIGAGPVGLLSALGLAQQRNVQAWQAAISGSTVKPFERAGHLPLDESAAARAAVAQFLIESIP